MELLKKMIMNDVISASKETLNKMIEDEKALSEKGEYVESSKLAIEIINLRKWIENNA